MTAGLGQKDRVDAPGRRRRLEHRLDVQGLRGIAVILVVAYHAVAPSTGGFIGVDVFFVVSGFVISRLLLGELQATGSISLRGFYARRVRRLLPALALVLVTVALASALVLTPLGNLQNVAETGIAAALFSANGALFFLTGGYFDLAADTNPLLHLWTLAVEEQFYVVFPLSMIVGWRLARRRNVSPAAIVAGLTVLIAVVSLALSVYLTFSSGPPFGFVEVNRKFAFFGSPSRAWEFCAGSLIALSEVRLKLMGRRWSVAFGAVGAVLLAATVVVLGPKTPFPGYAAVLPVAATSLLIIAGVRPSGFTYWCLTRRWLTWVGDQSYAWYLWHWPLIVFTRLLYPSASPLWLGGAALLGLLVAWVSGRFMEQPIRASRRFVGRRALALALVCVTLPSLGYGALVLSSEHPSVAMRRVMTDGAPHLDLTNQCTANLPGTAQTDHCTFRTPGAKGEVVLIGDSNAGQFAEPMLRVARERHLDLVLATYGGCPFANLTATYTVDPHDSAACGSFVAAWTRKLTIDPPTMVVVASASTDYLYNPDIIFSQRGGASTATVQGKAHLWSAGLSDVLRQWAGVRVPVVVVDQVPHFGGFDLRLCPAVTINRDASACAATAPTSRLRSYSEVNSSADREAVKGLPGVTTLNLFDRICGQGETCSTYADGHFRYRDGGHLSVPFAEALAPEFGRLVDDLSRRSSP